MSKRKTHAEFLEQVKDRPFDVLDKYTSGKVKIAFRCCKDGYEWLAIPNSILNGRGCPKCAGHCSNDIIADHGDWLEIDVSTIKHAGAVMKIDKRDWEIINNGTIGHVGAVMDGKTMYARCRIDGSTKKVHCFINPQFKITDHIDGNGLNNRSINLRSCTCSENNKNHRISIRNKSGVTGVYLPLRKRRWAARITHEGSDIHLGYFADKKDAISARKSAEVKYFGEFAYKGEH